MAYELFQDACAIPIPDLKDADEPISQASIYFCHK